MMIPVDMDTSFDKVKCPYLIKTQKISFNLIHTIYQKRESRI